MDEGSRQELEQKLKILSALDQQWGGGETSLAYAPRQDASTPVPNADEGILRVSKGTAGKDALLTLEMVIPKTGIACNASLGQGDPIRQADKYFGYLRALADKADVGLDESHGMAFDTDTADEGVSVTKHEFHFHSSAAGLSFQGKIQMRVHEKDSEKLHTALQQEIRVLQNQLAPLGEVPHESVADAVADGRIKDRSLEL